MVGQLPQEETQMKRDKPTHDWWPKPAPKVPRGDTEHPSERYGEFKVMGLDDWTLPTPETPAQRDKRRRLSGGTSTRAQMRTVRAISIATGQNAGHWDNLTDEVQHRMRAAAERTLLEQEAVHGERLYHEHCTKKGEHPRKWYNLQPREREEWGILARKFLEKAWEESFLGM